ncbi:hypothetical protein PRIEUP_LOCUS343 [Pristimantis euphronides]
MNAKKFNCAACAGARPHLGTTPFQLSNTMDPLGLQCILKLYNSFIPASDQCKTLLLLYPSVRKNDIPPSVTAYPGNYTCFPRSGMGKYVGDLTKEYSIEILNSTQDMGDYMSSWFIDRTLDIWWLYKDLKLRPRLLDRWQGTYTLV